LKILDDTLDILA